MFLDKTYNLLTAFLPARLTGVMDFYFRRDYRGAAFNGQIQRKELMNAIISKCKLNAIIETGTCFGATTDYFVKTKKAPIYTVENDSRRFYYSKYRFKNVPNTHVEFGDSVAYLKSLSNDPNFPKKRILFYLDAHWEEKLPLYDEVQIILRDFPESIVVVDDFKVEGDNGYEFDDYSYCGSGVLHLAYFDGLSFKPLFPTAPSKSETGMRRGCLVFATDATMHAEISSLPQLRGISSKS